MEKAKRNSSYFFKIIDFKPDNWQMEVVESKQNLLMNCARQSGKSTIAAIYAVYRAVFYDNELILLISPSQRQSGELFRIVKYYLYNMPLQPKMLEDNILSCQLENGSRIVSLPGTERTVRGYGGATLIIEDEASRVDDELYYTIRPMLAISQGKLILMSTPFGRRGHFWKEWSEGSEEWNRIMVRACDNPRISKEFLENERKSLGDWWYKQEYECEFLDPTSSLFDFDIIMSAISEDVMPLYPTFVAEVRA